MGSVIDAWRRTPPIVIDVIAVAIAAADAALTIPLDDPWGIAACILACLAVAVRRRWPLLAFVLTLPAALVANVLAAPLIALFALARRTRRISLLIVSGALFASAEAIGWPLTDGFVSDQGWTVVTFVYQAATAAAPILLGQLLQAASQARVRLKEIEATRRHEQELYAESVLARERNQLAREMHDVVSHQVSLIAIQAAALQVTVADPAAREAAASIRALSSTTLQELRTMVLLLRAAGARDPGLAPQPTLAELPALVSASGLTVTVSGTAATALGAAAQRAIYRTVQEALTNVRKHAPGAEVAIDLWHNESASGVTVTNGAMREHPLNLPGAKLGLSGLRERAELLGGSLEAGSTPDGFRVRLSLPLHET